MPLLLLHRAESAPRSEPELESCCKLHKQLGQLFDIVEQLSLNCSGLPTSSHPKNSNMNSTVPLCFRTINLAFSGFSRDRKMDGHCKLQDVLVTTTEHTKGKPNFRMSSFPCVRCIPWFNNRFWHRTRGLCMQCRCV